MAALTREDYKHFLHILLDAGKYFNNLLEKEYNRIAEDGRETTEELNGRSILIAGGFCDEIELETQLEREADAGKGESTPAGDLIRLIEGKAADDLGETRINKKLSDCIRSMEKKELEGNPIADKYSYLAKFLYNEINGVKPGGKAAPKWQRH